MRLIVATSAYPTHADESINAGVFVRDLVAELMRQGDSVHVLTPDKGEVITGSPAPVHTFRWGGSERVLTRLNPRRPGDLLRLSRIMIQGGVVLRRLIAQTQVDAVLAMWAVPAGYWASGQRRPYAVWVLGSDIWSMSRYPLGKTLVRRVLQRAGHIFSDGLQLAEDARRIAGRSCEFLPSCRRLPVAATLPARLPEDRIHFVFIGRWDRVKGIDLLLDAMEIVAQHMPHVHLHIFGAGPLAAAIQRRVERRDLQRCVTLNGPADPMTTVAYLKACDALVIPSRIESIPVIYSDALQCGCPVVSTNVGDLGRLIREQGTGLVCLPEDPADLAQAMHTMAREGRRSREQYASALSAAAGAFSTARSAERCRDVLAGLAGVARAGRIAEGPKDKV